MKIRRMEGILWMVAFTLVDAIALNVVRVLGAGMHTFQIICLCNGLAAILLYGALRRKGAVALSTNFRWHFLRASVELVGAGAMFYALMFIPVSEVKAILFLIPILASIHAVIFLREVSTPTKWITLGIGFLGMLMILQPGVEVVHFASLLSLLAALFLSMGVVIVKKASYTESPLQISFWMCALTTAVSLPFALVYWQPLAEEIYKWILLFGVLVVLAQITISQACSHAPLVVVTPFFFVGLIFVSIISYFAYGEVPKFTTFLGGAIIIAAASYSAYRDTKE